VPRRPGLEVRIAPTARLIATSPQQLSAGSGEIGFSRLTGT
jgi:hypothetical protein